MRKLTANMPGTGHEVLTRRLHSELAFAPDCLDLLSGEMVDGDERCTKQKATNGEGIA
jgi:hypothetical protein